MKAFFPCIAKATELKKDKIRVLNVKFASKRKSLNHFIVLKILILIMTVHTRKLLTLFLTLLLLGTFGETVEAQKKRKKRKKTDDTVSKVHEQSQNENSIEELVRPSKKIEGLFTFYQDTLSGSLKLLVTKEQLDKEYIHFLQAIDGVIEVGMYRGAYKGSKVFTIGKYFDRLEFKSVNTRMYFDKSSPLSKAAKANTMESILFSTKILASDKKKGHYLINADPLFKQETLSQIKPSQRQNRNPSAFKLGNLSKNKTRIVAINNYPKNSDVRVMYTYSNPFPAAYGAKGVTDARNVSITINHSWITMPDNDYRPRYDDPRVGYFTTQVDDMTSTSYTPYRDMIHRWHLKKKDPGAGLSEPVEPIVWWIENTTPLEFRETIKKGILQWNRAFEKAGFKNAIDVKIQPDTATWDAGDIRYNVLRWVSSPNPPFGGYGPSFVNPRTGQILGADIMLEFSFIANRLKQERLFHTESSLQVHTDQFDGGTTSTYCDFGEMSQCNHLFGQAMLKVLGSEEKEVSTLRKESMLDLIMHEVGHTLGLNHNMKSSQLFSPEQLKDKDFIQGKSLIGSVMDYNSIHLTGDPETQGHYYPVTVGPYDEWAITYGYFEEEAALDAVLKRSTEPALMFGNDADDMRNPGKAIDPRVMVGDMSNDAITYSIERMQLISKMMKEIKAKYEKPGESYEAFRQAYFTLWRQYSVSNRIISRYIGGVYVDRAMVGQEGGVRPYTPVPYEDQKRAMKALTSYLFAPEASPVVNELYSYLARQRRGFNFFSAPEDPKLHRHRLSIQSDILEHLLHSNTLNRISDSELYGNTYTLAEFMSDMNDSLFKADIYGTVGTFRRNLQVEYTHRLIDILSGKKNKEYGHLAKSMALHNLKEIRRMSRSTTGDIATKAHKGHLSTLIDNALEEVK